MKKKLIDRGGRCAAPRAGRLCERRSGGRRPPRAEGPKAIEDLVVGFAQVGAESGWRTANTTDIQSAFEEAGIELKFSDAQQKQENQIKAIRSYIQQKVDYIAFSPVVETGWDAVLNEAKAAGIPVILTDRAVDSADDVAVRVASSARTSSSRARRPATGCVEEFADADSGQDRPARGHDRLRAGDRPRRGIRRGHRRGPEVRGRREPDR